MALPTSTATQAGALSSSRRTLINLNVLKRHDPLITDILDATSHVVVYAFDEAEQQWTKRGVEGTLFIFERHVPAGASGSGGSSSRYGFFIMNRVGVDNFIVPLNSNTQTQLTGDYIIYKTNDDDIHGLWLYEKNDRERLAALMDACSNNKLESANGGTLLHANADGADHAQSANVLDMFMRAESGGDGDAADKASTRPKGAPVNKGTSIPLDALFGNMAVGDEVKAPSEPSGMASPVVSSQAPSPVFVGPQPAGGPPMVPMFPPHIPPQMMVPGVQGPMFIPPPPHILFHGTPGPLPFAGPMLMPPAATPNNPTSHSFNAMTTIIAQLFNKIHTAHGDNARTTPLTNNEEIVRRCVHTLRNDPQAVVILSDAYRQWYAGLNT